MSKELAGWSTRQRTFKYLAIVASPSKIKCVPMPPYATARHMLIDPTDVDNKDRMTKTSSHHGERIMKKRV